MDEERYLLQKRFGKRIRALRTQRDMTQEQLAVAVDITVVTVSRMENGIQAPPFTRLPAIAKALGVEVWEMFTVEEAEKETLN